MQSASKSEIARTSRVRAKSRGRQEFEQDTRMALSNEAQEALTLPNESCSRQRLRIPSRSLLRRVLALR
eukprot:3158108-Pleurochrysis_carterae.AAC.1